MKTNFYILAFFFCNATACFAQCPDGSCNTSNKFTPVPNSAYGNIFRYSYVDSKWYYKHVIETGNNFLPNPYGLLEETLKRDRQKTNHRHKRNYTDDVFDSIMNIR